MAEGMSTMQPMAPAPGPTGPATVRPSNAGQHQAGVVAANLGMKMLLKAAEMLSSGSKEKLVVIEALAKLERQFQGVSPQLTQQEGKMVGANANPAATASPEQQLAISRQQNQQRLASQAPALAG